MTVLKNDLSIPKMTAWLTINRSCNLRCNWCYAKMTRFAKEDMTLDTIGKSLILFKGLGLESVILLGGEPTIHPNFLEIVRLITEAGLKTYVVSNAIAFANREFLTRTIEAGVESVTISLKAANRSDFLAYTGKDKFKLAIRAIKNIVEMGIHHVINVTVCRGLIENFKEMIETFKQSNGRALSLDSGKPILVKGKTSIDGVGSPKRMAKFFIENYPILKQREINFSIKLSFPFCLLPEKLIKEMIDDGHVLAGCQMARGRGIIVDPKGKLISCNHLCNVPIGEIGKDFSVAEEYLNFRQREDVREFFRLVSSYPHERCVSCSWWKFCGGGCKLYWLHYLPNELIGDFR